MTVNLCHQTHDILVDVALVVCASHHRTYVYMILVEECVSWRIDSAREPKSQMVWLTTLHDVAWGESFGVGEMPLIPRVMATIWRRGGIQIYLPYLQHLLGTSRRPCQMRLLGTALGIDY
jgi:hypothetical protein